MKVGDFGLVTALSVQQDQEAEIDDASLSRHTAEVGTTLYMSPEQVGSMARLLLSQKLLMLWLRNDLCKFWVWFPTEEEIFFLGLAAIMVDSASLNGYWRFLCGGTRRMLRTGGSLPAYTL